MIYEADSKRPGESPIYALNIAKELALTPGDAILSVTAAVSLKSGAPDPGVGGMRIGPPGFSGASISQRVTGGVHGNVYALTFDVQTQMQTLQFVVLIPVSNEGVS